MVEFALLAKFVMVMDWVVKAGYSIAGGYLIKTGIVYVKDYKESVEKEREESTGKEG